MSNQHEYSRRAVIIATAGWLFFGSLLGGVVLADWLRVLSLPFWVVWVLIAGAGGCLAIATVISGQVRCKLMGWLPFGW